MERRHFKRIRLGLRVKLHSEGRIYEGEIEDISEKGINVITSLINRPVDFMPDTSLELSLLTSPGEELNLRCKVKWSEKTLPHGLKNRIGMEIIDPDWDKSSHFL